MNVTWFQLMCECDLVSSALVLLDKSGPYLVGVYTHSCMAVAKHLRMCSVIIRETILITNVSSARLGLIAGSRNCSCFENLHGEDAI